MNVEDMSFKELRDELIKLGILDENNCYRTKEKKEPSKYSYKKFIENSGLTTDEASAILEYAMETDDEVLRKKILKASEI